MFPKLCSAFVFLLSLLATSSLAQTMINVGPGQPHTTIQSAIDAAANGDTVLVAPGTYSENIDFKGKAITVTSSGGAAVTTIDGGGKDGVATVVFANGETTTSVISNFTIRGGGNVVFDGASDGGVYVGDASPVIQGNTITANYCHNIHVQGGPATIVNNEVSGVLQRILGANYCTFGSAINLTGSPHFPNGLGSTVIGNIIENNLTGSGVNLWGGQNVLIMNNIIRNNTSSDTGSAFTSANNTGTVFVQNLVYGNTSRCGGALAFMEAGPSPSNPSILIANNTIVDNVMTTLATITNCIDIAQIYPSPYTYGASGPGAVIINNIISGSTSYPAVNCDQGSTPSETDQPTFQNNILNNAGGPFFGNFCVDVSGKYNNIAADPQFVSPSTGDYHLKNSSPAIDSGENTVLKLFQAMTGRTLSTDFDGKPRVQGSPAKGCTIDMGAYESPGTQSSCVTTETLTSSLNPSTFGQTVTFTAQLSSTAGVPTGDVQFTDGSTVLGIEAISSTGVSTFSTGQLTIGSHPITATYQPTGSFAAASANLTQVVTGTATATTLTCSPNSINVGSTSLLSAAVTSTGGTPTGSIAFTDNGAALTTQALLSGAASFTYTGSVAGTHTILATYVPTAAFAASSATCSVTVNLYPTTTTIASSLNPSSVDQVVTFTATVHFPTSPQSLPTVGSITFSFNGTPAGTSGLVATSDPLVYTATIQTQALPPGNNIITANLNPPFGVFASSSASLTQVVNQLPSTSVLSVTPTAATFGTPITLTATVSGTPPLIAGAPAPTGTVTFRAGATLLGTATLNITGTFSTAVLNTGILPVGNDQVSCTYSGDTTYAPSACNAVSVAITPAATLLTLTSSNNPAPALTPVIFTAHLTNGGQPTAAGNTITLGLNGQTITLTTDATGSATFTIATLTPGVYPVTANFAATTNLLASATSLTETITVIPTTTTLTIAPNPAYVGQLVTMTATVSSQNASVPVTSGVIGFFDGPIPLSTQTVSASGTVTFTTSTLAIGAHPITARFSPLNAVFTAGGSPQIDEMVLASGFTIAVSPATLTLGPGVPGTVAIQLASVGNFAGPLTLTYGTLPTSATASITPATVTLTAGGTGSSTLTLNTLLKASNTTPTQPGSRELPTVFAALLLACIPRSFSRRNKLTRHKLHRFFVLTLLALGLHAITGCTNAWYTAHYVAPGTYQLPVTATDINHNTQTAIVTVVVTP